LRLFDGANTAAAGPAHDVAGVWRAADPTSAAEFSAAAYFFARELRRELALPVGVIAVDWGGTPAEAWTPAAGLTAFPEFAADLARLAETARDPAAAEARLEEEAKAYWTRALELDASRGLGPVDGASEGAGAGDAWAAVELPATFEDHGLAGFDGLVWYRRELELPPDWAGQELVLELGAIDDRDTTYWNGTRIGGHEQDAHWQTPRRYAVPAALVRSGRNELAVRVLDTGGLGGFASAEAELRLARSSAPGAVLSLAGPWRWRAGTALAELGRPPGRESVGPGEPSALWNGMVAPLVPRSVAGVIWYQGEANRAGWAQYERLFPALIGAWRTAFGRAFPFYFVQIAPFGYEGDRGETALLRDAQRKTLARVSGTGMAVTMDIGDALDIHPLKKREVGERLAGLALARTYGRARADSGPLYRSCSPEGAFLRLAFEHARGLTTRGAPLRHALLAGADRVFHPAEARIEGETLLLWSPAVPAPLAARFGWGTTDATNLWNAAGLPASSFRTDDWPVPE
jgi:sialate O-acetylesterase